MQIISKHSCSVKSAYVVIRSQFAEKAGRAGNKHGVGPSFLAGLLEIAGKGVRRLDQLAGRQNWKLRNKLAQHTELTTTLLLCKLRQQERLLVPGVNSEACGSDVIVQVMTSDMLIAEVNVALANN